MVTVIHSTIFVVFLLSLAEERQTSDKKRRPSVVLDQKLQGVETLVIVLTVWSTLGLILLGVSKPTIEDVCVQLLVLAVALMWLWEVNMGLDPSQREYKTCESVLELDDDIWSDFERINSHVDEVVDQMRTYDKLRAFRRSFSYYNTNTWGRLGIAKFAATLAGGLHAMAQLTFFSACCTTASMSYAATKLPHASSLPVSPYGLAFVCIAAGGITLLFATLHLAKTIFPWVKFHDPTFKFISLLKPLATTTKYTAIYMVTMVSPTQPEAVCDNLHNFMANLTAYVDEAYKTKGRIVLQDQGSNCLVCIGYVFGERNSTEAWAKTLVILSMYIALFVTIALSLKNLKEVYEKRLELIQARGVHMAKPFVVSSGIFWLADKVAIAILTIFASQNVRYATGTRWQCGLDKLDKAPTELKDAVDANGLQQTVFILLPLALAQVLTNIFARLCDKKSLGLVKSANGARAIIWPLTLLIAAGLYNFASQWSQGWKPSIPIICSAALLVVMLVTMLLARIAIGASDAPADAHAHEEQNTAKQPLIST